MHRAQVAVSLLSESDKMELRKINDKRLGLHVLQRLAAAPLVGYPLLLFWQKGWLPKPRSSATALLRDGRLLRCKLADRTQRTMYFGLFEPRETRLLAELLSPGDTFIDVGAHIGWFTTLAARRVGAAGHVIACEPYPPNATILKENLARNDCINVRVVEAALGAHQGTISLAKAGGDSGGVTALDWAWDGQVEVPMTTLDEISDGLGAVTIMKVDVEGWEAQILRGATKTLAQTKYVLIEINSAALKKAGSSPEEVFNLLHEAGFAKFLPIVEGGLRRLHRSHVSNTLAIR
jgi:FkbM family methyltransferase